VIGAVAVVPSAPLLLPEYTGRVDAGAALRERSLDVVRAVLPPRGSGSRLVLVFATDREPRSTRASLGSRVGTHLLDLVGAEADDVVEVAWDAPVDGCRASGTALGAGPGEVALVVVADGSARRGEKAPGHLDERSLDVDRELVDALRAADPDRLLALDAQLCADLLVHGRAPLQVAAAAIAASGRMRCVDLEAEDPFGVLYVTARLEPVTAGPGGGARSGAASEAPGAGTTASGEGSRPSGEGSRPSESSS
jgi:hypothetical protein